MKSNVLLTDYYTVLKLILFYVDSKLASICGDHDKNKHINLLMKIMANIPIFILIFLSSFSVSADMSGLDKQKYTINIKPVVMERPLSTEERVRVLAANDEMALSESEIAEYDSDSVLNSEKESIIPKTDYIRLNIKPLYSDSIVSYKEGYLVEEKLFENNIWMMHFITEDQVWFMNINSRDPNRPIWAIICSVDKITDAKKCRILKDSFFYAKNSDEPSYISLGGINGDYSRPAYIRIDKNKALKTNDLEFRRPVIDNILKQMTLGDTVYLRYYKKYESNYRDEEISLIGFSTVYEVLNLYYSRLN